MAGGFLWVISKGLYKTEQPQMLCHKRKRLSPSLGIIIILLASLTQRQAQGCTVYSLGSSSLPTAATNLLIALPIFQNTNGTLYIDNHDSPFSCSETEGWENGWHDFFETAEVLPWSPTLEKDLGGVCARFNDTDIIPMVPELKLSYLDLQTTAAVKMWKFQPWMESRLETALKQLELQPHPIVAFNLRGGNKERPEERSHFAFVGPEDMMEAFEKSYPGIHGGTCLIVGDDRKMVDAMGSLAKKRLGCRLYAPHSGHTPHANKQFFEQPLAMRCTHAIQTLIDVELLAAADICIGAYKGTVPDIVEVIRYALRGKKRLTFADASAYYHKDWVQRIRHYVRTGSPGKKTATQHRHSLV